jgi:hypothetical protein
VQLTGYLHPRYIASLAQGTPIELPACGAWLLKRPIAGTSWYDATGPYPLLCCADWRELAGDFDRLSDDIVSIVAIADPLGGYSPQQLAEAFDRRIPYKEHFVVETGPAPDSFVSRSHRAHAMRALGRINVTVCERPGDLLDEWCRLYQVLAERHSIPEDRRMSRAALAMQLEVPGLVVFQASAAGQTVGLDLWYEQGDCAQGHLAAFDELGYSLRASYATKWRMLEYFRQRVRWINLGGVPDGSQRGGLAAFKRGWATTTRIAWLCERVLAPERYKELTLVRGTPQRQYFPAYRSATPD